LVAEQLDLSLGHLGPAFVDLGLLPAGRIEHGGVRARLIADAHEVVEDRLFGELLDDVRARGPAGEAGRNHGLAQRLQRARDVDALAPGRGALLDRAMTPAKTEVRYRERLVDRRVKRDRDDHLGLLPIFRHLSHSGLTQRATAKRPTG